jgi:hypothetical protein
LTGKFRNDKEANEEDKAAARAGNKKYFAAKMRSDDKYGGLHKSSLRVSKGL